MINTEYRNQLLRKAADRLAQSIQSADGAQVARLFRAIAFESQRDARTRAGAAGDGSNAENQPERIGIWQRRVQDGQVCFVRRQEDINFWRDWANIGRLEVRKSKTRVLLIGESVARAFFYEPRFTLAQALQSLLELELGRGTVEVIDLARTNLGCEVRELAIAALALEPDALVLFCGNNWNAGFPPSPTDQLETELRIAALRAGGVSGLRECMAEHAKEVVEDVVRRITDAYARRNIPVCWIVPEFNLGDWHDRMRNAPYLVGERNGRWTEAFKSARRAMREQNFREAIAHAQEMTRLDQGLSAAAPSIIGNCCKELGDLEEARRYLQLARDAETWDWSSVTTPRSTSLTQEIIRRQASVPGVSVIDLPKIFAEHLGGGIADRRLFLDYCHLTSEGIRVSMAATAAALLSKWKSSAIEWTRLLAQSPAPAPELEADARLLAALHNAHWAQPPETIRRLCTEAVQASSTVTETMALIAQVQSTRVPALLSRTSERIVASDSQAAQHFVFHQSIQRYDKTLVEAIVDSLGELDPEYGASVTELRLRDHSAARRPINLLDFYYGSSAGQLEEICWVMPAPSLDRRFQRADFYRAYSSESLFCFAAELGHPLRLRLVLRLCLLEGESGAVTICLNGEPIWEGVIGREWKAVEIAIDPHSPRTGTNELAVFWPEPSFSAERELGLVADRLSEGIMCPLRPIYGEIHSATVGRA